MNISDLTIDLITRSFTALMLFFFGDPAGWSYKLWRICDHDERWNGLEKCLTPVLTSTHQCPKHQTNERWFYDDKVTLLRINDPNFHQIQALFLSISFLCYRKINFSLTIYPWDRILIVPVYVREVKFFSLFWYIVFFVFLTFSRRLRIQIFWLVPGMVNC